MKYLIPIFITILSGNISAQTVFNITAGHFKISGDETIVLHNAKWQNEGTFTPGSSTVEFTGTANSSNAAITGSSETSFYNLIVNKATNNVGLESNTGVQNSLDFQSGCIQLGDADLVIDPAASVSSTASAFVKTDGLGSLVRTASGGAVEFPVGTGACMPLVLENTGTSDIFYVRVDDGVLENGTSGNAQTSGVVDVTWYVEEVTPGGSDATLTVSWYIDNELSGFDRSNCSLAHYNGGAWEEDTPEAASGSNPYSISRSGVTSFSPFAVSGAAVLPVETLYFRGYPKGGASQLEWATATEINSDFFEVQHSVDGRSFQKIGQVKAAGSSAVERQYDFLHLTPAPDVNYYRLQQVDYDGSFEYSTIISLDFPSLQNMGSLVEVYPNPTAHFLYLKMPKVEDFSVEIFNNLGQLVIEAENQSTLNVQQLMPGVYQLKFTQNKSKETTVQSFVVQR